MLLHSLEVSEPNSRERGKATRLMLVTTRGIPQAEYPWLFEEPVYTSPISTSPIILFKEQRLCSLKVLEFALNS
jgi:hypothetical protein